MENDKYLRDDHESLMTGGANNPIDPNKQVALSSCPQYDHNPFRNTFLQHFSDHKGSKINFISKRANDLFDGNGEQISENGESIIVGKRNVVDAASFTKIYHDAYRLFGISNRASKLLIYITSILQANALDVVIDTDKVCQVIDIGMTTYYRAIQDLVNHKVLARSSSHDRFFINPIFIFNGNRITIVDEYIKEGTVLASSLGKNANIKQIGQSYNNNIQEGITPDTSKNQPDIPEAESEDEFGV